MIGFAARRTGTCVTTRLQLCRNAAQARADSQGQGRAAPHVSVQIEPVEVRREYRISLGPWSTRLSLPESMDLMDLADRARGLLGMVAILGVAFYLSENRRAISRRVSSGALPCNGDSRFLCCVFRPECSCFVELATPWSRPCSIVLWLGPSSSSAKGWWTPSGPAGFVFAFRVLPTVIFVAALSAVLYHLGVMQRVVRVFAWSWPG